MARLILLEDEPTLRHELAGYLEDQGHFVDAVGTIAQFRKVLSAEAHLIALVDLGLPDGNGIDLINELRGHGTRLGIVVISARGTIDDRVLGLTVGADHYLKKPIELEELSAVITSLSRRLVDGGVNLCWVLDIGRGELMPPGKAPVPLTPYGAIVLKAIVDGGGAPVDRRVIVQALGEDFLFYDQRRLDTQIHQLRKSIADASGVELPIRAVRNRGYQFLANIRVAP